MVTTQPSPRPVGPPARPVMLTVLGWIWVALGGLFTLISLFVATAFLLMPGEFAPRFPEGADESDMPSMAMIEWAFGHFEKILVLQILVPVAMLLGGVFLLRRRAWARALLEGISWLGMAYTLLFTGWFIYHWLASTAVGPTDTAVDPALPFFRFMGVAAALLSVLFYAGPLGVLIWMLRHRTVRGALGRGAASGP